jgi:hypothetical protein
MEAANEELPTDTVVYMGDFLIQKHIKLQKRRDAVYDNAKRIQKKGFTEKDDPFAAPLYTKAAKMDEELEAIARHISFIMRGGRGQSIPSRGYLLQHANPPVPPPVRITVSQPVP